MRDQQTLSDESVAAVALDERSGAWRADGTVVGQEQKPASVWLVTFRRLRRSKTAMFGLIIACLVFTGQRWPICWHLTVTPTCTLSICCRALAGNIGSAPTRWAEMS